MGAYKKVLTFANLSKQSYGFPVQDFEEYWIKKYAECVDNQSSSEEKDLLLTNSEENKN